MKDCSKWSYLCEPKDKHQHLNHVFQQRQPGLSAWGWHCHRVLERESIVVLFYSKHFFHVNLSSRSPSRWPRSRAWTRAATKSSSAGSRSPAASTRTSQRALRATRTMWGNQTYFLHSLLRLQLLFKWSDFTLCLLIARIMYVRSPLTQYIYNKIGIKFVAT